MYLKELQEKLPSPSSLLHNIDEVLEYMHINRPFGNCGFPLTLGSKIFAQFVGDCRNIQITREDIEDVVFLMKSLSVVHKMKKKE